MNITPLHSSEYEEQALTHDLLPADREAELVKRAQGGDIQAMNELLYFNQRLIHIQAKKYYTSGATGGQEMSDLMQLGRMGFITAVEKFNFSRAQRLSTYATWWIRAYINRYGVRQGSQMHLSYQRTHRLSVITRIRASLIQKLQRYPTPEEVYAEARRLGKGTLKLAEIESLMKYQRSLPSLDKPVKMRGTNGGSVEGDLTLGETIPDDTVDVEEEALRGALIASMMSFIGLLSEQQQLVLKYRYGENLTFSEIGEKLGVSGTTVSAIEKTALEYLRRQLDTDL